MRYLLCSCMAEWCLHTTHNKQHTTHSGGCCYGLWSRPHDYTHHIGVVGAVRCVLHCAIAKCSLLIVELADSNSRNKSGTSAAQVRHKCGTSAAQVRNKCGTSAAQARSTVRSTVRIACGTSADAAPWCQLGGQPPRGGGRRLGRRGRQPSSHALVLIKSIKLTSTSRAAGTGGGGGCAPNAANERNAGVDDHMEQAADDPPIEASSG